MGFVNHNIQKSYSLSTVNLLQFASNMHQKPSFQLSNSKQSKIIKPFVLPNP